MTLLEWYIVIIHDLDISDNDDEKKLIWILFLETEGKGWIGEKIKYAKCQK